MWILSLVGYLGILLGFGFLTLAIASGLYYLSELVEEHTVLAKKLLTRLIYFIIFVQILLALFDHFPVLPSLLSIGSHAVYAGNLRRFPIVKLTDPLFISSCLLVALNHYVWFKHFSTPPSFAPSSIRYSPNRYDRLDIPSFTDIASYFGICVWLVPFALFVSLSAGENVLPSMGSEYATGELVTGSGIGGQFTTSPVGRDKKGAKGMVRVAVDGVREWVGDTGESMGFWRGDKTRRF